jgi:hypothetical protein
MKLSHTIRRVCLAQAILPPSKEIAITIIKHLHLLKKRKMFHHSNIAISQIQLLEIIKMEFSIGIKISTTEK